MLCVEDAELQAAAVSAASMKIIKRMFAYLMLPSQLEMCRLFWRWMKAVFGKSARSCRPTPR